MRRLDAGPIPQGDARAIALLGIRGPFLATATCSQAIRNPFALRYGAALVLATALASGILATGCGVGGTSANLPTPDRRADPSRQKEVAASIAADLRERLPGALKLRYVIVTAGQFDAADAQRFADHLPFLGLDIVDLDHDTLAVERDVVAAREADLISAGFAGVGDLLLEAKKTDWFGVTVLKDMTRSLSPGEKVALVMKPEKQPWTNG
jgi:hypothetical protein